MKKLPKREMFVRAAKRFKGTNAFALELGVMIRKVSSDLEREIDQYLQQHGLLSSRFSVLMHLLFAEKNELKPITIAEKMGVTRGNMTGLLDGLQKEGWVVRQADPQDRRTIFVRLTAAGHKKIDKAASQYFKSWTKIMEVFSDKEKQNLIESLLKIYSRVEFK